MNSLEKPTFSDQAAQQVWVDYLSQVEDLCGLLLKWNANDKICSFVDC